MKPCLIKQPAGIGDIFFCQKIARYMMHHGYDVIWPVLPSISWIKDYIKDRLTGSIELALKVGNVLIIIDKIVVKEHLYSENFSCPKCRISFEDLEPRAFSFNSPFGACEKCDGLGTEMLIDPDLVVRDKQKSLIHGCIEPIGEQPRGNWYSAYLKSLSKEYNFCEYK